MTSGVFILSFKIAFVKMVAYLAVQAVWYPASIGGIFLPGTRHHRWCQGMVWSCHGVAKWSLI